MAPAIIPAHSNLDSPPTELYPYKTLSYDARLTMLDREGSTAVYERRHRIRVTAPSLSVFLDRVWGEGVLFRDYWTGGLDILEAIRTRSGWVVILQLPREYRKGESFEIRTERKIVGGFMRSEQHWGSVMFAPTKSLDLEIVSRSRVRQPALTIPKPAGVALRQLRSTLRFHADNPEVHALYQVDWAW
jgi:hypothetical protein